MSKKGVIIFSILIMGCLFFTQKIQAADLNARQAVEAYFSAQQIRGLNFVKQDTDELGITSLRYNQSINNVPVFGGQLIAHVSAYHTVRNVSGKILTDLRATTTPEISKETAIATAQALWQQQFNLAEGTVKKSQLYIFNKSWFENTKTDTTNYLVWEIELYQGVPAYHEYYFINALDGSLVKQITGIQTSVNRNIRDCSEGANIGYGYCWLDTDFPFPYDVYNFYYGRSEGQPARGANPNAYISPGTDVDTMYDYIGYLYDYYLENYNRDGANNYGGIGDDSSELINNYMTISYPKGTSVGFAYIDYYWMSPDSEYQICPNAFFNGTNSLHFCKGEVYDDVIGHEYGHAVNYYSVLDAVGAAAGLTYSGESGALNEANSDIFGEAIEAYVDGTLDWLHGEDAAGGASRNMMNPAALTYNLGSGDTPYPTRFNDPNYYCGTEDNGGVHINSSVANHLAYLMSESATFNGCSMSGIGHEKVEDIFYRVENTYYTPATDFNQAYLDILNSCADLYGLNSTDCRNVKKALLAVEMDQAGACSGELGVDPTAACAAIDAPADLASITADTASGSYPTGTVIDVILNFSKPVTSNGNLVLSLNASATATCTAQISNAETASCSYTVQAGDNVSGLDITTITGTATDEDGWSVDLTPPLGANLSDNVLINIDTLSPEVNITNPDHGEKSYGGSLIKFSTSADAESIECKLNNKTAVACANGITKLENLTGWEDLDNGEYDLSVTVTDAAGNSATDQVKNIIKYNPPVISVVTSDHENGYFTSGEQINIQIYFSKKVTSTGTAKVKLETGSNKRTCKFTVTNANTASCVYTVKKHDQSTDLNVKKIIGTIKDGQGNSLGSQIPESNLADNKQIKIDTRAPHGSLLINKGSSITDRQLVTLKLSATDTLSGVKYMRFSNDRFTWSNWLNYKTKYSDWDLTAEAYGGTTDSGIKKVYVEFMDRAGNISDKYKDTIIYQ